MWMPLPRDFLWERKLKWLRQPRPRRLGVASGLRWKGTIVTGAILTPVGGRDEQGLA